MRTFLRAVIALSLTSTSIAIPPEAVRAQPRRGILGGISDNWFRADWRRTSAYYAEIDRFVVDARAFDNLLRRYQSIRRPLTSAEQQEIITALDLERFLVLLALGQEPRLFRAYFNPAGAAVLVAGMSTTVEVAAVLGFAALTATPIAAVLLAFYGPRIFNEYIVPTINDRCIQYVLSCSVVDVPSQPVIAGTSSGSSTANEEEGDDFCQRAREEALRLARNNPARREIIPASEIGDARWRNQGWSKYAFDLRTPRGLIQVHFMRRAATGEEADFKISVDRCS